MPPNSVASPICAESGFKPTSTAVVTPSNVNIAWIPMTIKKYPVAQVIILFDNPQIPIKPAKIGAKTIPKKTNSKKNSNGAKTRLI